MHHSYSSQSLFMKPFRGGTENQIRFNNYNNKRQLYDSKNNHDITIPNKEYQSQKYYHPSNDYYSTGNALIKNCKNQQQQIIYEEELPSKSQVTDKSASLEKLKKKVKQIKYALKIAQEHNQQLHDKLKSQKNLSHQQLMNYEKDLKKYKGLYEMLIDNYEKKSDQVSVLKRQLDIKQLQLSEAKKVIKSYQKEQKEREKQCPHTPTSNKIKSSKKLLSSSSAGSKNNNPKNNAISAQYSHEYLRQLLTRQQVSLQHLTHQNKVLREQLTIKSNKLFEYQILISTYQQEQKLNKSSSSKQLTQLTTRINQLQQENQKLLNEKPVYLTKISRLQIQVQSIKNKAITTENELQNTQSQLKQMIVINEQIQKQLDSNKLLIGEYESGERKGKWKLLYDEMAIKYNEVLRFYYQNQKEIQKEIHLIGKEMERREILKYNNHNDSTSRYANNVNR